MLLMGTSFLHNGGAPPVPALPVATFVASARAFTFTTQARQMTFVREKGDLMSTCAAVPDPFYPSTVGARYKVDLTGYLGESTIASVAVEVDWSPNAFTWSTPSPDIQSSPAVVDDVGLTFLAFVGNRNTAPGWVRLRTHVVTDAVPAWEFDDVSDPFIEVLDDVIPN